MDLERLRELQPEVLKRKATLQEFNRESMLVDIKGLAEIVLKYAKENPDDMRIDSEWHLSKLKEPGDWFSDSYYDEIRSIGRRVLFYSMLVEAAYDKDIERYKEALEEWEQVYIDLGFEEMFNNEKTEGFFPTQDLDWLLD